MFNKREKEKKGKTGDFIFHFIVLLFNGSGGAISVTRFLKTTEFCCGKKNKRTMMVLYRSPDQICIFTVEVSAKFTALGFLYKLYSTNHPTPLHHTPSHVFYKSWQLELNLKRGSPKEHFCQVILKLVQWFKKFYIAIKPYALTAIFFFFDESWQLEQLGRGSPKEHSCQVLLKSVQWFLTRRFLKFSI